MLNRKKKYKQRLALCERITGDRLEFLKWMHQELTNPPRYASPEQKGRASTLLREDVVPELNRLTVQRRAAGLPKLKHAAEREGAAGKT